MSQKKKYSPEQIQELVGASNIGGYYKEIMRMMTCGNMKGRAKKERTDISKMSKRGYIQYLEAQVASMSEVQKFLKRGMYP